jgi:hypothetical protein
MNYPSIRIEGAILSPDILDHLDDAAGQRPTDFGLDTGTSKGRNRPRLGRRASLNRTFYGERVIYSPIKARPCKKRV